MEKHKLEASAIIPVRKSGGGTYAMSVFERFPKFTPNLPACVFHAPYNLGMRNTILDPPKLLNTGKMARRLRVQVAWLQAEAEAGRIPAVPAGRTYLFFPEAVEAVLLERAQATPPEVASDAREPPA